MNIKKNNTEQKKQNTSNNYQNPYTQISEDDDICKVFLIDILRYIFYFSRFFNLFIKTQKNGKIYFNKIIEENKNKEDLPEMNEESNSVSSISNKEKSTSINSTSSNIAKYQDNQKMLQSNDVSQNNVPLLFNVSEIKYQQLLTTNV